MTLDLSDKKISSHGECNRMKAGATRSPRVLEDARMSVARYFSMSFRKVVFKRFTALLSSTTV